MPTAYIKKLSKEGKGSVAELEKKWHEAKDVAEKEGHPEDYPYIMGIFKRMADISKTRLHPAKLRSTLSRVAENASLRISKS